MIQKIDDLREIALSVGLVVSRNKGAYDSSIAALRTAPGCYPSMTADYEVYRGTVDELRAFLDGMLMLQKYYDVHLKVATPAKVSQAEQKIKNRQTYERLQQ